MGNEYQAYLLRTDEYAVVSSAATVPLPTQVKTAPPTVARIAEIVILRNATIWTQQCEYVR